MSAHHTPISPFANVNPQVSTNVGPAQMLNFKSLTERRENMLWIQLPPKARAAALGLPDDRDCDCGAGDLAV